MSCIQNDPEDKKISLPKAAIEDECSNTKLRFSLTLKLLVRPAEENGDQGFGPPEDEDPQMLLNSSQ